MTKTALNNILLFILLVVCQAVIFNNIVLMNTAIAFVFLYLLVELPITLSTNAVVSVGFVLGLSVDVFQDTPGLNALACTVTAFMRKPIYHLYVPQDEDYAGRRLGIGTLGSSSFLKYLITFVLLYCFIYFTVESLDYINITRILGRTLASAAFTFVVIYAIDSLTLSRREKKL